MFIDFLNALPGAVAQGLIWGLMAIGVYISYKILDIADLTVDGSICTGGCVCATLIIAGVPAWISILVAFLAGMVTGVIWAIAGDIGGRAYASTVVGVFDWAVYMGAAIQAMIFGWVKDTFGWSAIFITIGFLYIVMLGLTLAARNMKMKKI